MRTGVPPSKQAGRCPRRPCALPGGAATSRPPEVQWVAAWPRATTSTRAPASARAIAAVIPARPAPTTTTSDDGTVGLVLVRAARRSPAPPCTGRRRATAPAAGGPRRSGGCRDTAPRGSRGGSGRRPRAEDRAATASRSAITPAARNVQNPPWQGPMPSRVPRRTSSRLHGQRSSRKSSSIERVTSSHSQMRSASPPPLASCSASRWPSQ